MSQLTISVRLWHVRTKGAWRSLQHIARTEPVWLVAVVATAVWGVLLGVPRLLAPGRPWMPAAVVVVLATLLEATRSDERLVAMLGGHFTVVRFVDAILWLVPLLAVVAVTSPGSAMMAVVGIAGVALVPTRGQSFRGGTARAYRVQGRLVSLGAVEWVAGLRGASWPVIGGTVLGVIGPAHPLVIAASLVIVSLTATSYHWAPSEGWLLIHVAGRGPRSYLWRKVSVSCGLLAIPLGAILASAAVRAPSLAWVFTGMVAICLYAHTCGILCRYAGYEEGAPLPAAGTLTWLLTSALVFLPPAALIALWFAERRAVARLRPYALSPRGRS